MADDPEKVFFSFYFKEDAQRVSQIKQIGAIEGQPILTANEWEEVKKGGDDAIEKWIAKEMKGSNCLVVLIGTSTAKRRWVKHEIEKAWNGGKGVLGVYVHNLKNLAGEQSTKGTNPFQAFTVGEEKTPMADLVKAIDPPYSDSKDVYDHIKTNLANWVSQAIRAREDYAGRSSRRLRSRAT